MFWKKKSNEGSGPVESAPKAPSVIVQQYLINEKKIDPTFAPLLMAVTKKNATGGMSIRLFDESDAAARKIKVDNYTALDANPGLVIFEGSLDETAKKVELVEKNKFDWDTKIYTEAEIIKQIESLTQPGATVFYFQTRGGQNGGPLGKGANIIELNPNYPGKGQKKYNIYVADVVDMQPVNKSKLFDDDKPKKIANWVVQGHAKRMYS